MKRYSVAVIGGDGIGPEVTREALRAMRAVAEIHGFGLELREYPFGTEHWLKTKETLPDSALSEMRQMNAIYLGAIGDPRAPVGEVEKGIILGVRFGLDLYINLRPIRAFSEYMCPLKDKKPDDVDFVVVRENTEGAYAQCFSFFKKGTPDEVALQEMVHTRKGVERCIRYAFDFCRKRNKRKKLTLVDKANALRSNDIWRRTYDEVGQEYPDIEKDAAYVDAACMWMIKNPEWFDVIVTENLFGDVMTDIGAALQGGLGIAASGNINPGHVSMFEPIHGSAPKHAGKNVACPLAAIMAGSMLLDHIGEPLAARRIYDAVAGLLRSGRVKDISTRSGHKTTQLGDWVLEEIQKSAKKQPA